MRSVLGPIFSNFFMFDHKNKIFNSIRKPSLYRRYVDDVLILAIDINEINILQDTFLKIETATKNIQTKMFIMFNQIWINIYIVIRRQTCFVQSKLFSVARQAGSKPGWLKRQSKILPLSHEETSTREGNLNGYIYHIYFCLHISA